MTAMMGEGLDYESILNDGDDRDIQIEMEQMEDKGNIYTMPLALSQSNYSMILSNLQIEILELIFFKIRYQWLCNKDGEVDFIEMLPSDISKFTMKYKFQSKIMAEAVSAMDGLQITTNVSGKGSFGDSCTYTLKTEVYRDENKIVGFKVAFDIGLFELFNHPKRYAKVNFAYFAALPTKEQKLFYKFFIPFSKLKNGVKIDMDVLFKILNTEKEIEDFTQLRRFFRNWQLIRNSFSKTKIMEITPYKILKNGKKSFNLHFYLK